MELSAIIGADERSTIAPTQAKHDTPPASQILVDVGTGILNNELYVGRLIWNRQRFVKDPETGHRP